MKLYVIGVPVNRFLHNGLHLNFCRTQGTEIDLCDSLRVIAFQLFLISEGAPPDICPASIKDFIKCTKLNFSRQDGQHVSTWILDLFLHFVQKARFVSTPDGQGFSVFQMYSLVTILEQSENVGSENFMYSQKLISVQRTNQVL